MSRDERVAAATTELAKAFDAEAHLLCSDSKPKVVELAEAALSMNVTKTSGNETRNAIRDLEKIARRFEIPIERIHRRNGKENHAIERVIDPLGAGLIVTHYRPGTIFGGLFPHNAMPKPADARCDLLVLGGNHEPIF